MGMAHCSPVAIRVIGFPLLNFHHLTLAPLFVRSFLNPFCWLPQACLLNASSADLDSDPRAAILHPRHTSPLPAYDSNASNHRQHPPGSTSLGKSLAGLSRSSSCPVIASTSFDTLKWIGARHAAGSSEAAAPVLCDALVLDRSIRRARYHPSSPGPRKLLCKPRCPAPRPELRTSQEVISGVHCC